MLRITSWRMALALNEETGRSLIFTEASVMEAFSTDSFGLTGSRSWRSVLYGLVPWHHRSITSLAAAEVNWAFRWLMPSLVPVRSSRSSRSL